MDVGSCRHSDRRKASSSRRHPSRISCQISCRLWCRSRNCPTGRARSAPWSRVPAVVPGSSRRYWYWSSWGRAMSFRSSRKYRRHRSTCRPSASADRDSSSSQPASTVSSFFPPAGERAFRAHSSSRYRKSPVTKSSFWFRRYRSSHRSLMESRCCQAAARRKKRDVFSSWSPRARSKAFWADPGSSQNQNTRAAIL